MRFVGYIQGMNNQAINQARIIGPVEVAPRQARRSRDEASAWLVALLSSGPVARGDILRTYRWLSAGALDEACRGLLDDGMIAVDRMRSKGRPAVVIRLTDEARAALASASDAIAAMGVATSG